MSAIQILLELMVKVTGFLSLFVFPLLLVGVTFFHLLKKKAAIQEEPTDVLRRPHPDSVKEVPDWEAGIFGEEKKGKIKELTANTYEENNAPTESPELSSIPEPPVRFEKPTSTLKDVIEKEMMTGKISLTLKFPENSKMTLLGQEFDVEIGEIEIGGGKEPETQTVEKKEAKTIFTKESLEELEKQGEEAEEYTPTKESEEETTESAITG